MKQILNRGYLWMEANPMTVMLVSLGLGAFATVAVVGVALRGEETRSIITRSACAVNPDGKECQRIKRESDEQQSVQDACVPFRKVDRNERLLRLTKCGVAQRREVQGNSKSVQNLEHGPTRAAGGGATSPSTRGSEALGPRHGDGSTHQPQHHGSGGGAAPAPGGSEGGSAPDSAPETSSSPTATQPEQEQPQGGEGARPEPTGPLVPALEGVKGAASEVVSGVNGAANEVVGGVQDTGCQLLGHCPTP